MKAYEVLYEAYLFLNKHDDAVKYGKESLRIAKETGNKKDEMLAHLLLGDIYLHSMQLSDCSFHLKEGLEIAGELKDDEAKQKFTEILVLFYRYE
jgi:hypothetical protein